MHTHKVMIQQLQAQDQMKSAVVWRVIFSLSEFQVHNTFGLDHLFHYTLCTQRLLTISWQSLPPTTSVEGSHSWPVRLLDCQIQHQMDPEVNSPFWLQQLFPTAWVLECFINNAHYLSMQVRFTPSSSLFTYPWTFPTLAQVGLVFLFFWVFLQGQYFTEYIKNTLLNAFLIIQWIVVLQI